MDARSFTRLREEHLKALKSSRERIEKWERFKGDYEALQARLYTLPDKLTHDVMVPFGRFGFMPGKMYHTNEVMVLLGDNWFAERTCRQAMDMVERRKQYVVEKLEEEFSVLRDCEARVEFTEEMRASRQEHGDVVEIKEDLTAEDEDGGGKRKKKEWRARRPKRHDVPGPRPAFDRMHPPTKHPGAQPESRAADDRALWSRLDELEREEAEDLAREETAEERERTFKREGGEKEALEAAVERGVVVKDGDQLRGTEEARAGSSSCFSGPLRIAVRHTGDTAIEGRGLEKAEEGNAPPSYHEEPSDQPMFRTPGDIFRRPVLLHSSEDSDDCAGEKDAKTVSGVQEEAKEWAEIGEKSVRWDPVLEHCQSPPPPDCTAESSKTSAAAPEAFSGQVVERTAPSETVPAEESSSSSAPRVSRFKASRKRN